MNVDLTNNNILIVGADDIEHFIIEQVVSNIDLVMEHLGNWKYND